MTDSSRNRSETKKFSRPYPKWLRLFFKQLVASLLCGILFFLMHILPAPFLNNCARALGDALRYEVSIPTDKIPHRVKERIAPPQ